MFLDYFEVESLRRKLTIIASALILIVVFSSWYMTSRQPEVSYPAGLSAIEKAALKAERIQAEELRAVTEALKKNDSSKIIYGDRFLRWTVLTYTLWRIDQGDTLIVGAMKDLLVTYYNRAWYPNVKNRPKMPFESLIQYLRADGAWEDYWNDYKPVHVAAFILEYYTLSCFDKEWGMRNYQILKNVADSLTKMWLPERHQPCAYIDASGTEDGIQIVEIKDLTASVDSAFEYAALIAAAEVARILAKDMESYERYTLYANDLIAHFYNQTWNWFPTRIFGSNTEEAYGIALQLGMTLPFIDGDEKVDQLKEYLVKNLRENENSWLIKWRKEDKTASSRSVYAAIGLAPKYSQMAYDILEAYAKAGLSNDPWYLTETDGYEGKDPVWVSGKYLLAYTFFKDRTSLGRIPFSPKFITGNLTFQSSYPSEPFKLQNVTAIFPSLHNPIQANINNKPRELRLVVRGSSGLNITINFQTEYQPTVSCSSSYWRFFDDRSMKTTRVTFVSTGEDEIIIKSQ